MTCDLMNALDVC